MPKKNLKDIAYNYIYEEIMSNRLLPNNAIIEQEISNHLGISRTPVREALKLLEAKGLVYQVPSRGVFVSNITIQDLEEIFELRIMLETAALKKAINTITDAEIDEIERNLLALDNSSSKEEYYKSDRDLHKIIMEHSGNTRMVNIHKTIESHQERFRRISSMTPDRLLKSRNEHMEILNALRKRSYDLALSALVAHLNNVKESTINVCKQMYVKSNTTSNSSLTSF